MLVSWMFHTARPLSYFFFFFNDTATTEIYTLSLHDMAPPSLVLRSGDRRHKPCEPTTPHAPCGAFFHPRPPLPHPCSWRAVAVGAPPPLPMPQPQRAPPPPPPPQHGPRATRPAPPT